MLWTSAPRDSETKCSSLYWGKNTTSSTVLAVARAAHHAVTAAAVHVVQPAVTASKLAVTAAAQNAAIAIKVRLLKELLELNSNTYLVSHFLLSDDQGNSDYYERKEPNLEMQEREEAADNVVEQQEN